MTDTDMKKMQAEAVNSARAMYRRASPSRTVTIPTQQSVPQKPPDEAPPTPPELPQPPETAPAARSNLLAPLFEDKERTLIILLIILLGEDGADEGILLALMYCIL